MSLIQLERVSVGEVGVLPGSVKMVTTDNLATLTAAGYINQRVSDVQLSPSDVIECLYSYNVSTGAGTVAFFSPSLSGGVITLNFIGPSAGGVTLPVVSGNFANFDGITGLIKDSGFLPSNAAKTRVVMLNAAPTVGHIAAFTDVNGTIGDGGVLGTAAAKAASDNALPTVASVGGPTVATRIAKFIDATGSIDDVAGNAVNLGDIIAGVSGTQGKFISFPPTGANGSLIWQAIDSGGAFNTTVSNSVMGQSSVISIPDPGLAASNFLLTDSAATQIIATGSLSLTLGDLTLDAGNMIASLGNITASAGNLVAGSIAGGAGTIVSYPTTAANGSLVIASIDSGGAFDTTISNSLMGQSSIVSIPDPGAATANFLLSATAAGTQSLSGALSLVGGGNNIQLTGGGNFIAGADGVAGFFVSYPPAATSGRIILEAINSGNFDVTINNAVMGQATVYTIPDPANALGRFLVGAGAAPFTSGNIIAASGTGGLMADGPVAANKVLTSAIVTPDVSIDLISFDVTVGQAALAGGGSVVLITSAGAKQYKIRSLQLNSGGVNFSGGGGDRLGQVTDGVTVYSVVPAATMQALTNEQWGTTGLPNPAAAAINTSTAAGANLVFSYSGGTVDYTAGSLVITGIAERVA